MAVGTMGGLLRVFTAMDVAPFWVEAECCEITTKDSGMTRKMEWIEDLKFSPDSKYLAVTSHNDRIYLFECPNFIKWEKLIG